jgi:hypothetical protein
MLPAARRLSEITTRLVDIEPAESLLTMVAVMA